MKYEYLIYNAEEIFGCTIYRGLERTNDVDVLLNHIKNNNAKYITMKEHSKYLHIIEYDDNKINMYANYDDSINNNNNSTTKNLLNNDEYNGYKIYGYYHNNVNVIHTIYDIDKFIK